MHFELPMYLQALEILIYIDKEGVGSGELRSCKDVAVSGVNLEQRLVILLSKNCRKAEASVGAEMEFGSVGGGLRQRRPSRADQSLRDYWLWAVIRFLKYVRRDFVISFVTTFD